MNTLIPAIVLMLLIGLLPVFVVIGVRLMKQRMLLRQDLDLE